MLSGSGSSTTCAGEVQQRVKLAIRLLALGQREQDDVLYLSSQHACSEHRFVSCAASSIAARAQLEQVLALYRPERASVRYAFLYADMTRAYLRQCYRGLVAVATRLSATSA